MTKLRWAILILFLSTCGFIYHASTFRVIKNFHVVEPGKFYRSAQLTGEEFEDVVRRYGIKTVINLRGSKPGQWWYDDEASALAKLGVRLESVGFFTEHVPSAVQLTKYTELLREVPRPILVHCRAGSDRTGEATAMYIMDYMNGSREQALTALTFQYLHVELFQPAKRYFIEHYRGPEWAAHGYDPCSAEFRAYASKWVCPPQKSLTVTSSSKSSLGDSVSRISDSRVDTQSIWGKIVGLFKAL